MQNYQSVRSLPYGMWQEFVVDFVVEFCPKNEVQTACMELETSKYFEGSQTVNEYIDEFHEMIEWAHYFKGAHIVLKFCQGLNPKVQDYIACLMNGRPLDEIPLEWYAAARLCDENHIANEAFKSSLQMVRSPEPPVAMGSCLHWAPTKVADASPLHFTPPIATPSYPSLASATTPA